MIFKMARLLLLIQIIINEHNIFLENFLKTVLLIKKLLKQIDVILVRLWLPTSRWKEESVKDVAQKLSKKIFHLECFALQILPMIWFEMNQTKILTDQNIQRKIKILELENLKEPKSNFKWNFKKNILTKI